MIAFHLPIVPPKATSQTAGKRMMIVNSKKTGKPMPLFFKNQAAASAEHDILVLCAEHKPRLPLVCPVRLQVDFVWPWRKSESKKTIALGRIPHTARPDCSNIIKLLEDCLTKLEFWADDSQIADLHVTKAWGNDVGIYVAITPLEGEPQHPPLVKQQPAQPTLNLFP